MPPRFVSLEYEVAGRPTATSECRAGHRRRDIHLWFAICNKCLQISNIGKS
jgi:hypothetical protein